MLFNDKSAEPEKQTKEDNDIFYRLYMKYFPKVKSFINYFVKSEEVAEDLSQDVFEYIWMHRRRFFGMDSLNGYLFSMAKTCSIDYLSHKKIEENYVSSLQFDLQENLTEQEIQTKDLEELIQLTVDKMPQQRRLIFELSRNEGLKNVEISEKLNISKKTVENHLNLALKQIKVVLKISLIFFV